MSAGLLVGVLECVSSTPCVTSLLFHEEASLLQQQAALLIAWRGREWFHDEHVEHGTECPL